MYGQFNIIFLYKGLNINVKFRNRFIYVTRNSICVCTKENCDKHEGQDLKWIVNKFTYLNILFHSLFNVLYLVHTIFIFSSSTRQIASTVFWDNTLSNVTIMFCTIVFPFTANFNCTKIILCLLHCSIRIHAYTRWKGNCMMMLHTDFLLFNVVFIYLYIYTCVFGYLCIISYY